jgi:hypothetical protein
MCLGSYCYIPSCHTCKIKASRGLKRAVLIHCGKPLSTVDQGLGSLPRVNETGGKNGRSRTILRKFLKMLVLATRIPSSTNIGTAP